MANAFETLDHILTHWADRTPEACAVRWPGGALSFAALQAQVQALADTLTAKGAGPGMRIGLYMEKSQASIIAAYAVLRCGAAYVPLDPAAPAARLSTTISSCGIELAIADPTKPLDPLPLALVLGVDGTELKNTRPLTARGAGKLRPGDPAYILYTSGTTGVPKGMVHTHVSGLAYVAMTSKLCGLRASDKVAHHTPLHFDMSIFDIFSTHSVGACCVVLPTMYTKMPASLSKLIEAEALTVWYSVPYALIQLAERGALDDRDLSSLRVVMFGGENILPGQLKRFADHVPQATFINAYGPAEINGCTALVLSYDALDGVTPIGIGAACEGVYTLISEDGELLVAGDQLMQGYWNDPARNAATLQELQGSDGVTRRYYTTGDIVVPRPDGGFDLTGRIDRQIKLRGHRIELDEVELAVASCAAVSETAVVFRRDPDALVAFVSPRAGATLDEAELTATCATILPPYAVPTVFKPMNDLCRTSTGKIDRMKLAEIADG